MDAPNNPSSSDRLQKLQAMLSHSPQDAFLLYALGMEHKKRSEFSAALGYFAQVIARDPDHCPAYQQVALTHQEAGDPQAARNSLLAGIAAAQRKGDAHEADEMQAALTELEG